MGAEPRGIMRAFLYGEAEQGESPCGSTRARLYEVAK
jgi:hypothetical protein